MGVLPTDAIGKCIAESDLDVVGYYRVRASGTMQLTDEDLAVAETLCFHPASVVLLIQRQTGDAEANFFFRDGGMFLNVALLSFPLNASWLRSRQKSRSGASDGSSGALTDDLNSPAFRTGEDPPARTPVRRSLPILLCFAVVLILGAAIGGAWSHYVHIQNDEAARVSVTQAFAALPLRAERHGGDLQLVWDLNSPGIASAMSGILDVDDGGVRRRIILDTPQLRYGSILYSPNSDQVSISLTALQGDGTAEQGSVLVILNRSQAAGGNLTQVPAYSNAGKPQPTRHFLPPAITTSRVEPKFPVDEMPPGELRLPSAAPLPPLLSPLAPTPEQPQPVSADVPFVPPSVSVQAGVRYPAELRKFLIRPIVVSVRLTVDEKGRVVTANAIQQNGILAAYLRAAEEAAVRCRFHPARRGNTAVPSAVILRFRFTPDSPE